MVNTQAIAKHATTALGSRSLKWLSEETGIPYTTLQRRFKDGNFTAVEMFLVAGVLEINPAELVKAAA